MLTAPRECRSTPAPTAAHEDPRASALIIVEHGSQLSALPGLLAHCRDHALETILIAQQPDEDGGRLLDRVVRRLRTLPLHGRMLQSCIIVAGADDVVERALIMEAALGYLSSGGSGVVVIRTGGAAAVEQAVFEYAPRRPARLRKCVALARSSAPAAPQAQRRVAGAPPTSARAEAAPPPARSGVFPRMMGADGADGRGADDGIRKLAK